VSREEMDIKEIKRQEREYIQKINIDSKQIDNEMEIQDMEI
jgi:hypothetical protein